MPSQPGATPASTSNAGIITSHDGDRHIPESTRADGSTRKAIKIRPGYRPAEDVEVYKNRGAENFTSHFRSRYKGGVVGAGDAENEEVASPPWAISKNAKRRAARQKAKEAEENGDSKEEVKSAEATASSTKPEEVVDPEVEKAKKARNLKKKLNQAKDLKNRKEDGEALLPDQIAKVIKISELIRELEALGFTAEGEPVSVDAGESAKKKDATKKAS